METRKLIIKGEKKIWKEHNRNIPDNQQESEIQLRTDFQFFHGCRDQRSAAQYLIRIIRD